MNPKIIYVFAFCLLISCKGSYEPMANEEIQKEYENCIRAGMTVGYIQNSYNYETYRVFCYPLKVIKE